MGCLRTHKMRHSLGKEDAQPFQWKFADELLQHCLQFAVALGFRGQRDKLVTMTLRVLAMERLERCTVDGSSSTVMRVNANLTHGAPHMINVVDMS